MSEFEGKFKVEANIKHYKAISRMRKVISCVTSNYNLVNSEELTENDKKYYLLAFKFYSKEDVNKVNQLMAAFGAEPIDGVKRNLTKEELDQTVITITDNSGNVIQKLSKDSNNGEHQKT